MIRNYRFLKLITSTTLVFLASISYSQDSRRSYFNHGWKFHKGDAAGAEKIVFKDDGWREVQLPHDWSIEGPFSEAWASGTGYLPGGIGWYRKSFTMENNHQGKQLYLYFDGIYKNSEIWINEKYVGKRPNGYVSFYHDITPYLREGKQNVIAVKVDHSDYADSRWYTGSGINRNVYLISTTPVHIDIWGIFFTTPTINEKTATVNVDVTIKNTTNKKDQVTLVSELLDVEGKVIAKSQKDVSVDPKEARAQLTFTVNDPRLWSPEVPNLYTLRTTLRRNGKVFDTVDERVGFRSFSFHPDKGFSLNGKSLKLKGVCFHDDAGALGSAVPRAAWKRRLEILKDLGCNAIRMSHNPHQDYLYDLCDEMGFLVQDEAFDEWEIGKNKWIKGWNVGTPGKDGYNKDFKEWAEADLRDMILRNRNRASVIMWSIGNEIDYPNDPYSHEILSTGRNPQIYGRGYQSGNPPAKRLGELAKQLVSVVKQYDSTRPVTAALAGVVMSNETSYPDELDVVGYNYQEYRYEEDHLKYPSRIIYGSENGKSFDAWMAVEKNDYIAGQFLWTAFDFLGEARAWPVRSSGAGLIDMAGFPKPEFYHRKSLWSSEPVMHLAASPIVSREAGRGRRFQPLQSHWNWNAGDSITVHCFTSMKEAELFLNGKSLGKATSQDAENRIIRWKVLYEPGELVVKGPTSEGKPLAYAMITTESPSKLIAKAHQTIIQNNPDDLGQIEISIHDANGRLVGNASNSVTVNVEGPAKLIGLESGSLSSHEDYKSNTRHAVAGRLIAYVQAHGKGKIKVQITSPNLLPYEVLLESK